MKKITWTLGLLIFSLVLNAPLLPEAAESASSGEAKVETQKAKSAVSRKKARKRRVARRKQATKNQNTVAVPQAAPAPKEEALSERVLSWLERMKQKISRTEAKHNQLVSVAAVRGADTDTAPPLYWKGKKQDSLVTPPELSRFSSAIEEAMSGDRNLAKKNLNGFIQDYPQSALVPDAQKALELLNE